MADPGLSKPDLLLRVQQLRAQCRALWEQVAEPTEAVAQVELEPCGCMRASLPRVGSLAAQAAEHARQAQEVAAREQAEAERLRRLGRAGDR